MTLCVQQLMFQLPVPAVNPVFKWNEADDTMSILFPTTFNETLTLDGAGNPVLSNPQYKLFLIFLSFNYSIHYLLYSKDTTKPLGWHQNSIITFQVKIFWIQTDMSQVVELYILRQNKKAQQKHFCLHLVRWYSQATLFQLFQVTFPLRSDTLMERFGSRRKRQWPSQYYHGPTHGIQRVFAERIVCSRSGK